MATNRQDNVQCLETSMENKENKCHPMKGPIFCEPCQYDESFEEVTGFCVTCSEYLCQTCCRDHKRNKVTRIHSLLKNAEIPADITPFTTIKQLSTCKIHPDNDIAYECEDHEALVCVFCLTENHRKCENVHDLGDVISADSDVNLMAALQERIHVLKAQKEEQRKTSEMEQEAIKNNIQSLDVKWKDHITSLRKDLETQLSKLSLSGTTQWKESIDDCHEIETEITRNKMLIETLMKHGTKRQITVVLRQTKHARADLKEKLQSLECKRQRNIALINVKQFDMLTAIAELSLEEKDKDNIDILEHTSDEMHDNEECENKLPEKIDKSIQTTSPVSTSDAKQVPSKPLSERDSGQIITLVNVKTATDRNICSIFGVNLPHYGILLADFGNSKLKLFSDKFDLISEQSLPGKPIDMTFDGEYAYVCYSDLKKVTKHSINKTSIGGLMEFSTRLRPISLTVFDTRLIILFATNENFDSTEVDDVHLEIRKGSSIDATISYDSDDECYNYVEDAKQVSVFDESSVVFSENTRVTCYTIDAQDGELLDRKWYYKSHNNKVLKKAKGVAKDSEGNIYVCGEDSNNVHQTSSTNYRRNRVVISNIDKPICVAVDEANDRLIIGCRSHNYLHVYSFK
ncbi:uncharacterized protein LOC128233613 [Mya arenaria]|uniref:uncharacterized protein LOC128233613 n=1 Tax=Mya arenaria TaxID=6604 RepID=UPI0022E9083C|nr:uncharacterized protein LOC128233613 [Mya arenaria]